MFAYENEKPATFDKGFECPIQIFAKVAFMEIIKVKEKRFQ